ncbi:MAG: hypothetical protein ACI8QC_000231 [Planctomycetota bacterium]|jgi:hypothetical protein
MRTFLSPFLAVLLVISAQARTQERSDWLQFRQVAGQEALPGLLELADWARANKLYAFASQVNKGVLTLDADQPDARRALRYFRVSGEWRQSRGFHEARNHVAGGRLELLEREYRDRLERVLGPFRDGLLARVGNPRLAVSPVMKEEILRQLLCFEPESAPLHGALDEERVSGRWVLRESARTLRGSATLRQLALACLDRVEAPERGRFTSDELKSNLALSGVLRSEDVRVTGTVTQTEIAQATRTAQAVGELFEEVFEQPAHFRRGFTVILLSKPAELLDLGPLAIARQSGLTPPRPDSPQVGGWLSYSEVAQWSPDRERRLDGLARQTMGAMLMDTYGLDARHGWIWEGVGLFLVDQLVGTRRTYFMEQPNYVFEDADGLWRTLADDKTDWLELAAERRAEDRWPGLQFLVGRSIASMRDEDLLLSYVLAAYVIQGWPDHAGSLLDRIGSGEHPVHAFEAVLGWSMPQLELRLERWLDEVLEGRRNWKSKGR